MRNILTSLIILLLLSACVPSPSVKPDEPPGPDLSPQLLQVDELEAADDFLAAAELLEEIAPKAASPQRETLLLRAAENRFRAGDPERASALLQQLQLDSLPELDFRKRLLVAEMAVAGDQPDQALALLQTPPPEGTRMDLQRRYHALRAAAFRRNGNLLDSGRELGEMDLLIEDHNKRLENQLTIIETYAALTDTALDLLQPDPPGIQGGWMELTRVIKTHANDPDGIRPLLQAWRQRFPQHPAMQELLDGYYQNLKALYRRPQQIAVLLPESGRFARVAGAIREGFLAAYYEQPPGQRPRLAFYDSSDPEEIWPLYQEAIEEGAEFLIGPLSKAGVAQFAEAGELDIPVLALNQVPPTTPPPSDLFQFSLSPEDEARQVAERAWSDGFSSVAALTPAGDWGDRIFDAFVDRWEQLGGTLAERQRYDAKENDFSKPIRALFNLDESQARYQAMQRLLGQKLEFEPRRRQDAGFIFLVAKSQMARQIRPQLQFHRAADMPVYTTSHIYSGIASTAEDQDLEGIRFPIAPWLIENDDDDPLSRQRLATVLPNLQNRYLPLYAMGMDSYKLPGHLARLQNSPREVMEGRTGNLYLDSIRQLHRQMMWAQIADGVPKAIGFTPRIDAAPEAAADSTLEQEGLPVMLQPASPPASAESRDSPIPQ